MNQFSRFRLRSSAVPLSHPTVQVATLPMPLISPRHLAVLLALALLPCGLSACGSINGKLADTTGDYVPLWAGGLPADAPPRPGTAKYDEFMQERERKRLGPATPRNDGANASSSAEAIH